MFTYSTLPSASGTRSPRYAPSTPTQTIRGIPVASANQSQQQTQQQQQSPGQYQQGSPGVFPQQPLPGPFPQQPSPGEVSQQKSPGGFPLLQLTPKGVDTVDSDDVIAGRRRDSVERALEAQMIVTESVTNSSPPTVAKSPPTNRGFDPTYATIPDDVGMWMYRSSVHGTPSVFTFQHVAGSIRTYLHWKHKFLGIMLRSSLHEI